MSETSAGAQHHHTDEDHEQAYEEAVPVKIKSYKDLLEEEQRLTMEFKRNKARVMEDFEIVKRKLQPADQALNFMSKLSGGTGKPGLVSTGVDIALDLLSKKYLFRKSGWLVTLAGSYLVRGVSQLFLQKKRSSKNAEKSAKSNGQDHPATDEMLNQ